MNVHLAEEVILQSFKRIVVAGYVKSLPLSFPFLLFASQNTFFYWLMFIPHLFHSAQIFYTLLQWLKDTVDNKAYAKFNRSLVPSVCTAAFLKYLLGKKQQQTASWSRVS